MVDQEDVYLKIEVNYKGQKKEITTKEILTVDELKNKIMELYQIPNTKNYLNLSYNDNEGLNNNIQDNDDIFDLATEKSNNTYILELNLNISNELSESIQIINPKINQLNNDNNINNNFDNNVNNNKDNNNNNELKKIEKEAKDAKEELKKFQIKELERQIQEIRNRREEKKKLKKEKKIIELKNKYI